MSADDMSGSAVHVERLSHRYKGRKALRKTSFVVPAGSIHGFVGPNGAGKTTTLKVLATLLKPTAGSVHVFGYDVINEPELVRKRIGFMPDHFSMYRQMKVGEYLDFFAAAYGLAHKDRDRVIGDVLELTDMGGRRNDLIRGLSRGMQQRVCLSRVLVHDPDLLLLDEPASGLDPRARIELMEILRELRAMGKTIFISSHILAELAELCGTVTIMDRGKVKYDGTMADLLAGRAEDEIGYRIRLAERNDDLITDLALLPFIDNVEEDEDEPVITVAGAQATFDTAAVLQAAISAGAQVVDFREDQQHLNQVFMDLTTPGVSK